MSNGIRISLIAWMAKPAGSKVLGGGRVSYFDLEGIGQSVRVSRKDQILEIHRVCHIVDEHRDVVSGVCLEIEDLVAVEVSKLRTIRGSPH